MDWHFARLNVQVHPHGCGENCDKQAQTGGLPGPSPRVWGKPGNLGHAVGLGRSIPTGVGKTQCRKQS